MTTAREGASATRLGDGRVLVAGGGNPSATLSAELYNPASGKWTTTGSMTDYHGPAAVLLRDGRVLVAGGGDAGDVYSPATGTWTATGPRRIPSSGAPPLPCFPTDRSSASAARRWPSALPRGAAASRSRAPSVTPRSTCPGRMRSPAARGCHPVSLSIALALSSSMVGWNGLTRKSSAPALRAAAGSTGA